MLDLRHTSEARNKSKNQIHWVRLFATLAGIIFLSFALVALLNFLRTRLDVNIYQYTWLAYISVFIASILANATIIAPVPFAIAIMVSAAQYFNPALIALTAALGGSLGELSGYWAGRFGRKIAIPDEIVPQERINVWVAKYGFWAIVLISFQPIIPFDFGGMAAGVSKMPLQKFLPALVLGKFPKYLIFVYVSLGLINFLPGWLTHFFS